MLRYPKNSWYKLLLERKSLQQKLDVRLELLDGTIHTLILLCGHHMLVRNFKILSLVMFTLRKKDYSTLFFLDLATQSMYQRMDSSFVGIIFAVFLTEQTAKAPSVTIFDIYNVMNWVITPVNVWLYFLDTDNMFPISQWRVKSKQKGNWIRNNQQQWFFNDK